LEEHLSESREIEEESKRYAMLYHDSRRNRAVKWLNHPFLPQEIIKQGAENDMNPENEMGLKTCPGCCRQLHRCSFYAEFKSWHEKGFAQRLCYTCFRVHLRDNTQYKISTISS